MKKKMFILPLLAALALTGCSSEENALGDDNGGDGKTTTSYMTVNLVTSDAQESRAANGFEDGTEAENTVNSVRFYFFNGLGASVNVKHKGSGYVNYSDWTAPTADEPVSDNDDIEKILSATIVINTATGDAVPQRIAAVINPPTGLLPETSMSLSALKEKVNNFATTDLTSSGKFVMYNSVGGGGTAVSSTLIEAKNLCASETDALDNPVTIYVERSVAKVRVTLDNAIGFDDNNRLALKRKNTTGTEEALTVKNGDTDQQVYLQLNGWSLTAETSEGRLIKKVNSNWEGIQWYGTHRSFWAINSMSATNKYYNYTSIATDFGEGHILYTNENAQTQDIDGSVTPGAQEKTKVIISGTLCDGSGTALTVVRHLGQLFVDNANLTNLKNSILNQLVASGYNYYYATDNNGRAGIGTDDIEIVPTNQQANENSKNNCYVYAKLTADAKAKTWYNSLEESATSIQSSEIEQKLSTTSIVDKALVWKNGQTYYYYTIKHINGMDLEGVVRNHIYETNVTKILGLGTPVYNPTLTIYPEKPDEEEQYIAAKVKILSWRTVSTDYTLDW